MHALLGWSLRGWSLRWSSADRRSRSGPLHNQADLHIGTTATHAGVTAMFSARNRERAWGGNLWEDEEPEPELTAEFSGSASRIAIRSRWGRGIG